VIFLFAVDSRVLNDAGLVRHSKIPDRYLTTPFVLGLEIAKKAPANRSLKFCKKGHDCPALNIPSFLRHGASAAFKPPAGDLQATDGQQSDR
jgi:hypothetical protein